MTLVYHRHFKKTAKQLPKAQREKLGTLLLTLQKDPFHSTLHTKRLGGEMAGLLSFRITRDWRVLFQFMDQQTVQLLRVKNRKDVYE